MFKFDSDLKNPVRLALISFLKAIISLGSATVLSIKNTDAMLHYF